jgi:hypothetical protein
MDMRFGTWNLGSLYRAVAKEILEYKLDLLGVREVRLDGGATEPAGKYIFFCGKKS